MEGNVVAHEPQTSVLIVDDHRMVADSLRLRMLSNTRGRTFGPVMTAYSLAMARTALNRFVPDVVLLDLKLGQECGLDLFPLLRALVPVPLTLILAAGVEPDLVIEGLTLAAGWVSKGTPFEELLVAINAGFSGRTYIAPKLVGPVLDQLLAESGRRDREETFLDHLSTREREVLECLVGGMTRQEVARHLFISPNTVRTHVRNLLRHAELHSTLSLIAAARELGVTGRDPSDT
ncbi:MAG: two component transcriptional regulator, LuxR family [Marmoricola sp.]|jgi:DNA-binding NarL/FixJ family response regulator|nr:two component transcriptional regulator, LuxR family [Marmoricola sp.]